MGQVYGCFQVKHSSVAIKEVFGKYDDVLEPGCHFVAWCFGRRVAGALSLRVKLRLRTMCLLVWLPQSNIEHWQKRQQMFTTNSPIPKHRYNPYVFDVIRASVPKMELDAAFERTKMQKLWRMNLKSLWLRDSSDSYCGY
ncbi:hypothetical protein AAZX31_02G020100 [Glycine max]|uniref:Uncharacterized protein n=1 Tax=Glycine max TaxID=3847 RepID=A0A0R0KW61_SOYBN|nr:hypersensitive-induced response protein 2-like [Glycine soja]KRH69353.1 hypothetical protein GLYMA_02G021200v4 [Glycine max]|eukprot:XP_014626654.1 hypersensitive-induced response protein 2 [Glycine max]